MIFEGGAEQNQQPDLDIVQHHFERFWLADLTEVLCIVREMLAFRHVERQRQVSQQLREMYPELTETKEQWLQEIAGQGMVGQGVGMDNATEAGEC